MAGKYHKREIHPIQVFLFLGLYTHVKVLNFRERSQSDRHINLAVYYLQRDRLLKYHDIYGQLHKRTDTAIAGKRIGERIAVFMVSSH